MTPSSGKPGCGNSVERLERAYREANRLVVAAGLVLASAGVLPSAPEIKALSAALRAVNHGRELIRPQVTKGPVKETDRAHPEPFGRRLRRAVP